LIRGYGVLSVLGLAFTVYCLLDVALTESDRVRNLPKATWVPVVLLLPVIGGVVWLLLGRPTGSDLGPGGRRSGRGPHPAGRGGPRPRGPEDDPRFLRDLDDRLRRMQREDGEDDGGPQQD
jgi:hypothetical protein